MSTAAPSASAPAKRLRVALLLADLSGGGAQRSTLSIANGLTEYFDVTLILNRYEGAYLDEISPRVHVEVLNTRRMIRALPVLARLLNRQRYDVLITGLTIMNLMAVPMRALSARKTKLVVVERNHLRSHLRNRYRKFWWVLQSLVPFVYPKADRIVTVSEDLLPVLNEHVPRARDRIVAIPNPFPVSHIAERAAEPVDHPWFRERNVPVIIGVGRLTKQKDFSMLLEAFAKLRQSRRARLLILGEGVERPVLEAIVARHEMADDVSLPGFVSNPFAYVSKADLFVLSSRWEGLPRVLLEALACGAKVVATDCPTGPREILADGKYGVIVPVGDVNAMLSAIERSLDLPRTAAASVARASDYDAKHSLSKYVKLVEDICV